MPRSVDLNCIRLTTVQIDQDLNVGTGTVNANYVVGTAQDGQFEDRPSLTRQTHVSVPVTNASTATDIWRDLVMAICVAEGLSPQDGDLFFPIPQ